MTTEEGRGYAYCWGCWNDVHDWAQLDGHRMCVECRGQEQIELGPGRWALRAHYTRCVGCGEWVNNYRHTYIRRCEGCWKRGRAELKAYGFPASLFNGLRNAHLLPEDIAVLSPSKRLQIYTIGRVNVERLNAAIPYHGPMEGVLPRSGLDELRALAQQLRDHLARSRELLARIEAMIEPGPQTPAPSQDASTCPQTASHGTYTIRG